MKNSLTSLIFLLSILQGFSQDYGMPKIIPPSPTVASLMRFEEIPVSNYTGQPNISIPFYEKKIGNGLKIPIAIAYNTNGIRIDERSGWLGTGWSFYGEAVISRTVMNIADDANTIDYGYKSVGVYHNGFFDLNWNIGIDNSGQYYTNNGNNPDIQHFLWNASNKGSGKYLGPNGGAYDDALDIYQVSLFGVNARFVVEKVNNTLIPKMISNDSHLKISVNHSNNFNITSFTIQDTKGYSYYLSVPEVTTTLNASAVKLQNNYTNSASSNSNSTEYVSAWKIERIENELGLTLAAFTYDDIDEAFNTPANVKENVIKLTQNDNTFTSLSYLFGDATTSSQNQYTNYNNSIALPKWIKSLAYLTIKTKKLKAISFHDSTKISFNNLFSHPEYTSGSSLLKNITITDASGQQLKSVNFTYNTTNNKRVFLDAYTETFENNTLTYKLNYERKEHLPSFGSLEKDIWGYYMPNTTNQIPIYKTKYGSDASNVTVGVLRSIVYPNGGVKEFNFESNSFFHLGYREFTDLEFKAYNPDNWLSSRLFSNFTLNGQNTYINDDVFNIDENQDIYIMPLFLDGDIEIANECVIHLVPLNNNQNEIKVGGFDNEKNRKINIQSGNYKVKITSLSSSTMTPTNIRIKIYYKDFKTTIDKSIKGGGLRIKNILFKNSIESINHEKKINYKYNLNTTAVNVTSTPVDAGSLNSYINSTSGVIDGYFTNEKIYILNKNHTFIKSGNPFKYNCIYEVKEHLNSVYVSLTNGANVGYSKVEVNEIDNGKSVFKYTSAIDSPTYEPNYEYPFFPRKSKTHLHGAIINEEVFNNSGELLKETNYIYYPEISLNVSKFLFIYDRNCSETQFYSTYQDYLNTFPSPGKELPTNSPPNGEHYSNCGTPAPVEHNFYPHSFNKFLLKEKLTKQFYYNTSGSTSTETKELYEYNNIYLRNKITKINDLSQTYISKLYFANDNLPNLYTTNTTTPSPSIYDGGYSYLVSQNKITDPVLSLTYLNEGNDDILLSGVRKTYYQNNQSLLKSVQLSKGEVTSLDSFKKRLEYTKYDKFGNVLQVKQESGNPISYIWGYGNTDPVAKLVNITYSQIENLPSFGPNFSLSNNGLTATQESQLRNISDASVTTFKYKPLVGIKSSTDARGYTTLYEYDEQGRLKYIKDENNNILSKNEYNYRLQN